MITASIVTYKSNHEEVSTVLKCAIDSSIELIYLIDNSPDDALRVFAEVSSKIVYIYGHGNIGYGAAHNIAIRQSIVSKAKYHVVINPDIRFELGTIEKLAMYMDQNADVGQVMPRIESPDGELQYLCKLLPTPMDLIGRRFIPSQKIIEKRNQRLEMRESGYDKIMEVPFLSGCFMFFSVVALDKIGGFDDGFFMYCEDVDICRRIGLMAYKTMYYPDATVVHVHKKESFTNPTLLKIHVQSAIRYFNKWGWLYDQYRRTVNRKMINQY